MSLTGARTYVVVATERGEGRALFGTKYFIGLEEVGEDGEVENGDSPLAARSRLIRTTIL